MYLYIVYVTSYSAHPAQVASLEGAHTSKVGELDQAIAASQGRVTDLEKALELGENALQVRFI